MDRAKKRETMNKKKGTKAKKQPGEKKKMFKAKKISKKSVVVEKTADYSLVSALLNASTGILFRQLWRDYVERAKMDFDCVFSKGRLSIAAVVKTLWRKRIVVSVCGRISYMEPNYML